MQYKHETVYNLIFLFAFTEKIFHAWLILINSLKCNKSLYNLQEKLFFNEIAKFLYTKDGIQIVIRRPRLINCIESVLQPFHEQLLFS